MSTWDQGWMHGNLGLSNTRLLGIAIVLLLIVVPISYYLINSPRTNVSNVIGNSNQILFPCNYNTCYGRGAWNVTNNSPTVVETVSPSYTCDCVANVTFAYSPYITTYVNGTTIPNAYLVPRGGTLLIYATALRIDGMGNMTVNLGILP